MAQSSHGFLLTTGVTLVPSSLRFRAFRTPYRMFSLVAKPFGGFSGCTPMSCSASVFVYLLITFIPCNALEELNPIVVVLFTVSDWLISHVAHACSYILAFLINPFGGIWSPYTTILAAMLYLHTAIKRLRFNTASISPLTSDSKNAVCGAGGHA